MVKPDITQLLNNSQPLILHTRKMTGRARPDGRMKQKAWTAGFREAGEV